MGNIRGPLLGRIHRPPTDVPVLLLNATAHAEDVRRFFPRAELRVPPRVATPNAQVRLVLGGFGKGTLVRHPRKLAELHDLLAVEHLGDDLGIVTHKATKTVFTDLGAQLGHHGAVAGDDTFRTVRRHAVIGAPSAPPAEIAALAAARSGRAVPVERAVQANAPVLLTDGSAVSVPVLKYAHPAAQAVHAGIFNAALDQAAHRPRQILRTEASPVAISIFANAAPCMPVDSIVTWGEVRPDRLMRMVARKRVHANAADMTAFHPELFCSERAAAHARDRFGPDWVARLHSLVARDSRPWARVRWQPAGQGQQLRWSWCPTVELAAMQAEIEAKLGALVHWQAEPWTPGRRPLRDNMPTAGEAQTPEGPGIRRSPALVPPFMHADSAPSAPRAPPDG